MNVLSLFDGMSCGMIALDRLGIKVDNYYASEIDKYAIQVSQANYPDIIQVGDITKLDLSTLPKIDLVMGGSPCQGFSFAGKQLAFDDPRSALFFEFHKAISYLQPKYFLLENVRMKKEYLDIISEYMGVEPIFINSSLVSAQSRQRYYWTNIPGIEQPEERGIVLRDILEDYPSQNPVKQTERNARHLKQLDDKSLCMTATMYKGAGNNGMTLVPQKLVDDTSDLPEKSQTIKSQYYKSSKANFERSGTFHATGIPQKLVSDKPQKIHDIPKDVLKDNERQRRVYSKEGKSPTLLARSDSPKVMKSDKPQHIGTAVDIKGHDQIKRVYSPDGKSPTVTTCGGGHREPKVVAGALRGRSLNEDGKNVKWKETKPKQILETRKDEKSNTVSTFTKDNLVVQSYREVRTEEAKKARRENRQKTGKDHTPFRAKELQPRDDGKVGTVTPSLNNDHKISLTRDKDQEVYWRKLTPLECERLQTVPDNYTNHVSNTQRYKMLGNGWTIEVIAHILQNMEIDNV
jgi:DNA-cytosine methyltransferase